MSPVELPPLAAIATIHNVTVWGYTREQLEAAVLKEREAQKQTLGALRWQYRNRPDWSATWNIWRDCSEEAAAAYISGSGMAGWIYEVRRYRLVEAAACAALKGTT